MYDAILLPTDGSEPADAAVDHAINLGRAFDATVHVLSVVEPIPAVEMDAATIHDRLREGAQTAAANTCERLDAAGVDYESTVRDGSPHRHILDAAEDADLIVMGTHGRTGVGRVLLGSVTERVVRRADAPVLSVRYHAEDDEVETEVVDESS